MGATYCLLDAYSDLDIILDEHGSQITGTLRMFSNIRMPLSGTVRGDTAVLTGADAGLDVPHLRIQRSRTGRLAGAMTMTGGWSAELELTGMALVPEP